MSFVFSISWSSSQQVGRLRTSAQWLYKLLTFAKALPVVYAQMAGAPRRRRQVTTRSSESSPGEGKPAESPLPRTDTIDERRTLDHLTGLRKRRRQRIRPRSPDATTLVRKSLRPSSNSGRGAVATKWNIHKVGSVWVNACIS